MSTIKLADYARKKKVTWLTAYRWYKAGKINAEKLPGEQVSNSIKSEIIG